MYFNVFSICGVVFCEYLRYLGFCLMHRLGDILVWMFHSRGQHSICCTFWPIGGSSVSWQLKQHGDLCQHTI